MIYFRAFLIITWSILAGYTAVVVYDYGLGLLPIFFGDIFAATWPGQFNLDFFIFLILSSLWTAWRNRFTLKGLGLAVLALFGGAGFLLPYLLCLSFKHKSSFSSILLQEAK